MELDNELNTYRSGCPVPHGMTSRQSDEQPESVDLLQMVPDASRSSPGRSLDSQHQGIPQYSKTRSLDSTGGQRMHFVLLPREEQQQQQQQQHQQQQHQQQQQQQQQSDIDADSGVHICHGCRDSDAYQQQHPVYRTLPAQHQDDGSIYFNYLRFANTSSRTSPCTTSSTYEPVTRGGRGGPRRTSTFSRLGRCFRRKSKTPCTQFTTEDLQPTKASPKSPPRDWRRIKRLLLLAGVLLGILVALGGMVVGFLLLSPKDNADEPCNTGFVLCGHDRCARIGHVCQGHVTCPDVDRSTICTQYNASRSDSLSDGSTDTFVVEAEKPLKGLGGWVHYSKGSVNGSKYIVMNKAMTFYGAQEECRKKGGYLAHINSIREQVFIEEMLKQELLNLDISQDGVGFWLGARRARGSHSGTCMYDQWKWIDPYNRQHGVIAGFTAFVPGKPDNYFDPEECLYISYQNRRTDSYLKWDDAPCDIHSVGGIKVLCEAELR